MNRSGSAGVGRGQSETAHQELTLENTSPIRVLIVDDEPGLAEAAAGFIERFDPSLDVITERTAEAGLEQLETKRIDCVVSDYEMPGSDGIEFLRAVREEYPTLPFILFTGEGSEKLASEAIGAGVTDYLRKQTGTDQYEMLAQQVLNAVHKRRAEQRVGQYLEASPDAIAIVGDDGTIRRVNKRFEELFGHEAGALVGQSIDVVLPERNREAHVGYREEYLAAPEQSPMGAGFNLQARRADETEFPVDVALSPLTIDGRQEVVVSVRDVTDRKEREEEIASLHRINRTLRETTQAAVYAETRPAIAQAVCETLATSEPYLFAWIGEVDGDRVVPAASAGVEEGYLEEVTVTADATATGRGPTGEAVRTHESQAVQDIHGDPRYEPWREAAEKRGYASSAAIPLVYDGTLHGVLNVYADRSDAFGDRELAVLEELGTTVAHAIERAELTDRLRAQYRDLFEEAPVMAVLTAAQDEPIVEACNQLFFERLDYEREAVIGKPLASFYTAESERDLLEGGGYDRSLGDQFTREERVLVDADGEPVETLLRAVPRRDETGAVVGTLALYVDISERKQLERENEQLDAFTSIVSHDLRNPLNVIMAMVEVAREDDAVEGTYLDGIADAADRMERLIEDLLTLSRQGDTIGDTVPISLPDVASHAWRNVESGDAEFAVDGDLTFVADGQRLTQLLENLYRNSVEHGSTCSRREERVHDGVEHCSPSGRAEANDLDYETDAQVSVHVGTLGHDEGFYVADDGPGIPKAERAEVFDHGYSTGGGTGFGLAIVRAIAEAHDWTVSVTESEAGGACFQFRGVETRS
jgi:PAS domain S-box-containing protein